MHQFISAERNVSLVFLLIKLTLTGPSLRLEKSASIEIQTARRIGRPAHVIAFHSNTCPEPGVTTFAGLYWS
jgi:hypothetical protein